MRKTSSNVIEHIDGIVNSCRNLNEHQLIGFKIDSMTSQTNPLPLDSEQTKYYGCIAQIHLLTKLPEMIWSRLDESDYFVATQLFIFSRLISTGLQLDANIMRKFPVARRQWNHLNQFLFMIKQRCLEQLEKPELSTQTAVKCLTSLVLLEDCKLEKVLTMFTHLRARAFRRMLTNVSGDHTDSGDLNIHQSAKMRILDSLQLLNETVLQVYKCFIDTNDAMDGSHKCLLARQLESCAGPHARPLINLINLDESLMNDTLPSPISTFKYVWFDFQIKYKLKIKANKSNYFLDQKFKCNKSIRMQYIVHWKRGCIPLKMIQGNC